MEDRIAITRLKQGDLNGLETLVNRYQVRAVQAAYAIVQDRALAEDVAQTAFVKAAERVHQFDETRPFGPWFFRIVLNDAIKAARQAARHLPLEEPDEVSSRLAAQLLDPAVGPEEWLEQEQTKTHILQAIRSLPPEQRAAIVMRYYLEMSETDMVRETKRPLSTVKWWLRDARRRLHDLIAASGEKE